MNPQKKNEIQGGPGRPGPPVLTHHTSGASLTEGLRRPAAQVPGSSEKRQCLGINATTIPPKLGFKIVIQSIKSLENLRGTKVLTVTSCREFDAQTKTSENYQNDTQEGGLHQEADAILLRSVHGCVCF